MYTSTILAKSEKAHKLLKSYPASCTVMPKAETTIPKDRTKLAAKRLRLMRLTAISEKVIMPIIVVYANKPKHNANKNKMTDVMPDGVNT